MKQYIDEDALVAEIKRRRHVWRYGSSIEAKFKREECDDFLAFLDTLEVKEADLEAELNIWRHNHFHGRRDKEASGEYLERVSQLDLAKHFFELGMAISNKTQKGG